MTTNPVDIFNQKLQSEVMEINPYAAPKAQILQATTQDEFVRREYLNTEASFKSIGILYYLGAVALIAIGVIALPSKVPGINVYDMLLGMIFLLVGVGMGVAAYGLRRLRAGHAP